MDIKDIKSLLSSLGFILFYVYATAGIVKLFWNTNNEHLFEVKIKFIVLLQILFAVIYIIGIYHIVGPRNVETYYVAYLIFQIMYVIVGTIANLFLKTKE